MTDQATPTPEPWEYCGEKRKHPEHCECGYIWGEDYPIAKVTKGEWGDEWPAIKVERPGSINESAVPYTEKMVYGSVNEGTADANMELIVLACNWFQDMAKRLNCDVREVPEKLRWFGVNARSVITVPERSYDEFLLIKAALAAGGEDD